MGLGRVVRRHSNNLNLSEIFFAPQRRGFVLSFGPASERFEARRARLSKGLHRARGPKKCESEEGV